eukprot:c21081_g1_i1 orf=346-942(-)
MEDEVIRRAVLDILKDADMDDMTESKVRRLAAEKLGTNLGTSANKKLVRKTVEEFLVAKTEEKSGASEEEDGDARAGLSTGAGGKGGRATKDETVEDEEERQPQKMKGNRVVSKAPVSSKDRVQSGGQSGDQFICQLSNRRNVSVQDWRGKTLISIREYYEKNGEMLPTSKGISLTVDQWEALKQNVPAIEDAIQKVM